MILPLGLCPDITIGPPKEPLCKTCFCSLTLFPGYYSELTHRQHLYFACPKCGKKYSFEELEISREVVE